MPEKVCFSTQTAKIALNRVRFSCFFALSLVQFMKIFVSLRRKEIDLQIMRRTAIVNQISEAIHRIAPTATAILYGSEARGDAKPDSDIDVLILLDGDHMDWDVRDSVAYPLYDIEWATGVSISPMIILKKDWENRPFKTPFYINVMNEGIRI